MNPVSSITVRQFFLILLIAALFGVLFWNLRFFLPALLGAYTLYVLLRDLQFRLTERWKWPVRLSATVLVPLSFVAVLLPFNWVFSMLRERVIGVFQNSDQLLQNAGSVVETVENQYGVQLLTDENIKSLSDWAVVQMQSIIGATVNGIGLALAMFFLLWFMLTEGKKMEQSFFNWLPLRRDNVEYLRRHLNDMVWSNALGIPLMGVVQGFAALLMYWLLGVEDPWMWFVVTFISGMMPVIGVALAYIPLTLILLSKGQEWQAVAIFLYGFIVVGSVDNIARMWVLKKIGHTHPLITLFGVIAGLKMFGFIGFVFGPIMIAMLVLLLKIYHKEFHQQV